MIRMFTAQENADEKETTDIDAEMETENERMRRYQNAEMCEVSDPENWVVYRHGQSETETENPNEDLDVDREARAGQEPPQQSSQLADGPVDTEVHEGQPQEA